MGEVLYTPANLASASDRIASTHAALRGHHEEMTGYLARTLGTHWTGTAQGAYTDLKAQFDQAMEGVHGVLAQLGQAVDLAGVNGSSTERGLTNMWSG